MLWLRTLLFFVLVPGTVLGLVPGLLLAGGWAHVLPLASWRLLGAPILACGATLMIWCFADFVRRGHGTPAPIDPPKRLVVAGPYRWVRNPMYVAGGLIVIGEAVFWEAPALLAYLGVFWLLTHLFVMNYEEPALTRQFGEEYRRYQRKVPRWVPRPPRTERGFPES